MYKMPYFYLKTVVYVVQRKESQKRDKMAKVSSGSVKTSWPENTFSVLNCSFIFLSGSELC